MDARELSAPERDVYQQAASQLARVGATSVEMRERIAWWEEHWPGVALTPKGLVRHWATVGGHVRRQQKASASRIRRTTPTEMWPEDERPTTPEWMKALVAQSLEAERRRNGEGAEPEHG